MNYAALVRFLIVSAMIVPLAGCSLLRGRDKGTTELKTAHGKLPVRREASNVVDLAQPTVMLSEDNVVVTGNVRLRSANYNPDARVVITIVDRYGKEANQIHAKLQETDQDRVLNYRVRFGPVPGRGSSLLVAYQDYQPFSDYNAAYIGSGGAGGANARSDGPRTQTGRGGSDTTNRRTYGGSPKGSSRFRK